MDSVKDSVHKTNNYDSMKTEQASLNKPEHNAAKGPNKQTSETILTKTQDRTTAIKLAETNSVQLVSSVETR
ncbi:hypothetical protein DCAR_0205918 [Daucus carota subsp. sativus]|uniref:Uncharacterized protein n=1 Tax=Daucus carota subsp. sativus TaxID=79200 RepID=A0A162AQM2_DAUCS|nr:hypothetical protein DCAR_0205918 [Daucus carota subsp. sativus]